MSGDGQTVECFDAAAAAGALFAFLQRKHLHVGIRDIGFNGCPSCVDPEDGQIEERRSHIILHLGGGSNL
jgi:hypothetical protein